MKPCLTRPFTLKTYILGVQYCIIQKLSITNLDSCCSGSAIYQSQLTKAPSFPNGRDILITNKHLAKKQTILTNS